MGFDIYCENDWAEMEESDSQNFEELAFMAGYCSDVSA